MKKILRFLLVLIVILLGTIIIAGLLMPNEVVVTRSQLIKAPKEVVFEQMAKFNNWPKWSPWLALDTNAIITYTGTDGTPGSSYTWDSKIFDVGKGTTTNTAINGTRMDFHIDFVRPFEKTAEGSLAAKDTAGMVKATWYLRMHFSFPINALQLFPFMSMDKMVGNAFEQGLMKLKRYAESQPVENTNGGIQYVEFPERFYLGIRSTIVWDSITNFYQSFETNITSQIKDRIIGPLSGLYYTWDTTNNNSDMMAAYPVSDTAVNVLGCSTVYIEPSMAYMATCKGSYANLAKTHMELTRKLAEKNLEKKLVIEEYVIGPIQEPNSSKWVTNVYYLVR